MTPPRPETPPPKPDLSRFGLLHFSLYVPRTAVSQHELELYDGVSGGKYTRGLGQSYMSFVSDCEDVISLALTATSALLRETGVSPRHIGRLDVGTETVLDKSKSIKTSLMRLFADAGNPEVDGLDCTNACYGATAALFNALAWAESSAWDGRLAIVVASDIAVYAPGPARATGGAAAVAMLLGPRAPLRFEPALRATVMGDSYDFFKPRVDAEYPVVRGQATVDTYVAAMDACYSRFAARATARDGVPFDVVRRADFAVFHSPFHRMVRKAFARLVYNDFATGRDNLRPDVRSKLYERFGSGATSMPAVAAAVATKNSDANHSTDNGNGNGGGNASSAQCAAAAAQHHRDRDAVRAFVEASADDFEQMCAPGAWLGREIGNCYTGSVYAALAALVVERGIGLCGKRIVVYSFGSGFAASMFAIRVAGDDARVAGMVCGDALRERLQTRLCVPPAQYVAAMQRRERDHGRLGYEPQDGTDALWPGTWYLRGVDEEGERFYDQIPLR